ncbi:MAG TPA: xanthine dehydrogenase family protein molybdopterin-binding subunit [Dehalococcoidia bacterium]|nr:xanthine dehydrogenase family protein molybdopterin-binding subunit [Dehalococcoidia bacterium]
MVAAKEYKVVGTRPIRHDGTDKVTGRAQYGADVRLTGMLYGKVKRSPHAHAVIKKIDTSRALALKGVHAVITRADFPDVPSIIVETDEAGVTPLPWLVDRIMAGKKALFRGHAIAAVAANDPHVAEDALDLIEVEYEVLPSVSNVREAMLEVAPILHADLRTRQLAALAEPAPDKPSNVAAHRQFAMGDVEKGFADADVIVEREFETSRYHQGYIEPHNATAYWSEDGHLSVWTSTQGLFGVRGSLSEVLHEPLSSITVNAVEIGGGFGGKLGIYLEPLAALLSRKTDKAVKMTMSREEVFEASGPTSGTYSKVKIGAKRDGTITAMQASMAYEAGAYPGSPVGAGMNGIFAPYNCPNQLIDGFDVVVNLSKTAAYRAPGTPASMFAGEAVVNELAEKLGMDPMELRLKNASAQGSSRANGQVFRAPIGNKEVMLAVLNHPHYRSELTGENRGRGVSMGFWGNVGGETSSSASVNADGDVSLVLGSVDIGGTRASISMQLAEKLGLKATDIHPKVVDTDSVGFTGNTGGSRTTFAGGWAAHDLAVQIRQKMVDRAAKIWECEAGQVEYGDDGVIRGPNDAEGKPRSLTFAQLAALLPRTGGTIDVSVNINYATSGPAFAAHIVDVEVDKDTGKVEVLRYTALQDVGTAIHPAYVEGQIQGAVAQGVGMALTEEYYVGGDSRMINSTFLDYRMPTALDLPMIDVVLVEVPNPGHPYGVRGVGEVPIVPPLAAVQTAVYNAIGVRFNSLPISPRVVLDELIKDDA